MPCPSVQVEGKDQDRKVAQELAETHALSSSQSELASQAMKERLNALDSERAALAKRVESMLDVTTDVLDQVRSLQDELTTSELEVSSSFQ